MNDKEIFAKNLKMYMDLNGKDRNDICNALGFNYFTVTDWIKARKMPRMDKVTKLADYFGIRKSDLIEEKVPEETSKKIDVSTDILIRMEKDADFSALVQMLYAMNSDQLSAVKVMLETAKQFSSAKHK